METSIMSIFLFSMGYSSIQIVGIMCFVVPIVMITIGFIIKSTETLDSIKRKKLQNLKSFETDFDIQNAMKIVIQFAPSYRYHIVDFDELNNIIVLCDETSNMNLYGNNFLIYFSTKENKTLIEIGIKNKGVQLNISQIHSQCFNELVSAFRLESNKNFDKSGKLFCSNCGKPYSHSENIKFCPDCGNRI